MKDSWVELAKKGNLDEIKRLSISGEISKSQLGHVLALFIMYGFFRQAAIIARVCNSPALQSAMTAGAGQGAGKLLWELKGLGAEPEARENKPFEFALKNRKPFSAGALITMGISLDNGAERALRAAYQCGEKQLPLDCMKYKTRIQTEGNFGLEWACREGPEEFVLSSILAGADPKKNDGRALEEIIKAKRARLFTNIAKISGTKIWEKERKLKVLAWETKDRKIQEAVWNIIKNRPPVWLGKDGKEIMLSN